MYFDVLHLAKTWSTQKLHMTLLVVFVSHALVLTQKMKVVFLYKVIITAHCIRMWEVKHVSFQHE